jgi:hypothetical protein
LAFVDALGVIADPRQLLQQLLGLLMEKTPGFGQAQRPAAFDQGNAELIFQLLDLSTQRRLSQVQLLGGTGEIQGLRDHPEIAQMTQLHDTSKVLNQTLSILDPTQAPMQSLASTYKKPRGYGRTP